MRLTEVVSVLRSTSRSLLSSDCVIAFGGFLSGYKSTNKAVCSTLGHLAAEFPGPMSADVCTRAFLTSPNSAIALHRVLEALELELSREPEAPPLAGPSAGSTFVETVRESILQGRSAMVLGREPTVVHLRDYAFGHIAGLHEVSLAAAVQQEEQLAGFDRWLRKLYGYERPWDSLIRAADGMCEWGLKRFVELWSLYEREIVDRSDDAENQ